MAWLHKLDWLLEKLEAFILASAILLMALNSVGNVFGSGGKRTGHAGRGRPAL